MRGGGVTTPGLCLVFVSFRNDRSRIQELLIRLYFPIEIQKLERIIVKYLFRVLYIVKGIEIVINEKKQKMYYFCVPPPPYFIRVLLQEIVIKIIYRIFNDLLLYIYSNVLKNTFRFSVCENITFNRKL